VENYSLSAFFGQQQEGFYWVILAQNPPEIAYWEHGEWWLAGDAKP
jgi:hypothetical protein